MLNIEQIRIIFSNFVDYILYSINELKLSGLGGLRSLDL